MLNWSPPVWAFVQSHRVARLATVDDSGRPLVLPVCYIVAGETLYSPIDAKPKRLPVQRLKRLQNIQQNPQVALVIDDYSDNWSELAYVILHGKAEILRAGTAFDQAILSLRDKYLQYLHMPIQANPMIAVALERVVSWGAISE